MCPCVNVSTLTGSLRTRSGWAVQTQSGPIDLLQVGASLLGSVGVGGWRDDLRSVAGISLSVPESWCWTRLHLDLLWKKKQQYLREPNPYEQTDSAQIEGMFTLVNVLIDTMCVCGWASSFIYFILMAEYF